MASFARKELANRKAELAKPIQKFFKASGMNQGALADYCAVSHTTVSKISRGKLDDVSFDKLYLIAIGLGFSVNMKVVCVQQ